MSMYWPVARGGRLDTSNFWYGGVTFNGEPLISLDSRKKPSDNESVLRVGSKHVHPQPDGLAASGSTSDCGASRLRDFLRRSCIGRPRTVEKLPGTYLENVRASNSSLYRPWRRPSITRIKTSSMSPLLNKNYKD